MKKIIRCAASVVLAMSFLAGLIPANLGEFLGLPGSEVRADDWVEVNDEDSLYTACENGGNIRLTGDVSVPDDFSLNFDCRNNTVIDLNGHSLTSPRCSFTAYKSLTVSDGSANGTGSISANIYTANSEESELHITGGTVSSNSEFPIHLDGGVFTMTGGTMIGWFYYYASGSYSITGGRFDRKGEGTTSFRNYIAEGYAGTENPEADGFYHVYKTYNVSITGAARTTSEGGSRTQTDIIGPMETVVLTAESGYQFRSFRDKTVNGITVTRIDSTHVRVEGTPTADTEVYIYDAVKPWVIVTTAEELDDALYNGSSVRLGRNIELDDDIYAMYSGTLDLNGFTLTINEGHDQFNVLAPEFVICDDSEGGGELVGGIYVGTSTDLSIRGGTITDPYSKCNFIAASVTIIGGRFSFDPTRWVPNGYRIDVDENDYYAVSFTGWELVANYDQLKVALAGNSCIRLIGNIDVPDAEICFHTTIDLNGYGLVVGNGNGTIRVQGGDSCVICDDSAAKTGEIDAGIVVDQMGYLSITGGRFDTDSQSLDIASTANFIVSGGRFRFNPGNWVADGYHADGPDASDFYEVVTDYSPEFGLAADSSKVYLQVRIPYVDGQMPEVMYGGNTVTLTPADGYGYFTVDCPMKNIADKVNLTVISNNVVIFDRDISVTQYLGAVMRTHPEYSDIIISMLRYSSAAQMCLNWPDGGMSEPDPRLANYGIADASVSGIRNLTIPSDQTRPSSDAIANAFNENLTHSEYYGMNLTYTYDTSLLIAFRITNGTAAEAQEEIVSYFAQWTTNDSPDYEVFEDASHNYIIVKILNVPIKKLGDTLFLVDPDPTDTYDQLVPIRIIDYFARVTASDSGKPLAVTDLVRSLYAYYLAASALN